MGLGGTTIRAEFLGNYSVASLDPLFGGLRAINFDEYDDRGAAGPVQRGGIAVGPRAVPGAGRGFGV